MLFFMLTRVLEPVWSPLAGLKLPCISPLLGALGRTMKTSAAGMCGKFQLSSVLEGKLANNIL